MYQTTGGESLLNLVARRRDKRHLYTWQHARLNERDLLIGSVIQKQQLGTGLGVAKNLKPHEASAHSPHVFTCRIRPCALVVNGIGGHGSVGQAILAGSEGKLHSHFVVGGGLAKGTVGMSKVVVVVIRDEEQWAEYHPSLAFYAVGEKVCRLQGTDESVLGL